MPGKEDAVCASLSVDYTSEKSETLTVVDAASSIYVNRCEIVVARRSIIEGAIEGRWLGLEAEDSVGVRLALAIAKVTPAQAVRKE